MKTIKKSNCRVEVYPRTSIYGIHDDEEDVCKSILNDIKRHVDSVSSAHLVWDNESVCEHCGSRWSEDDGTYNGGCCAKDKEDYDKLQQEKVLPI